MTRLSLTEGEASKRIDELQSESGRGKDHYTNPPMFPSDRRLIQARLATAKTGLTTAETAYDTQQALLEPARDAAETAREVLRKFETPAQTTS